MARKDKSFMVRVTEDEVRRVERVMELRGISQSAVVREAVRLYLYGPENFGPSWPIVEAGISVMRSEFDGADRDE